MKCTVALAGVLMISLMVCSVVLAEEAQELTVTGTVSVTKSEGGKDVGGKVTGVKLTADTVGYVLTPGKKAKGVGSEYVVVLDDNGTKLAEKAACHTPAKACCKRVKVVGTVEVNAGVKNLTVKSFEDVVVEKK